MAFHWRVDSGPRLYAYWDSSQGPSDNLDHFFHDSIENLGGLSIILPCRFEIADV